LGFPHQYVLTLTGAPRLLRAGTVTNVTYRIKIKNVGTNDTSNVTVRNVLPNGVEFKKSVPVPDFAVAGQQTYTFPSMPVGASKLILIEAALLPTTLPDTPLIDTAFVTDGQENSAQETFVGGVRPQSQSQPGPLTIILITPRKVFAGGLIKSRIDINNLARIEAKNVVVTLDGPGGTEFDSANPPPSFAGQTSVVWNFPSLLSRTKLRLQIRHKVKEDVPAGTVLTFTARVSDAAGRTDQQSESATVSN